jgi:hypothetical protein
MAETRSGSGRLSRLATGPKGHARKSCRPCGKSRQWDSIAACAALESDMTHISGFERSQLLLLPEAIDDYVVADNPVRFICRRTVDPGTANRNPRQRTSPANQNVAL